MTLSELLGKLQPHLDDRGDYMVIAGPLSGTDDSVEDKSFHSSRLSHLSVHLIETWERRLICRSTLF